MTLASEKTLEATDDAFGRHPGYRALHAKGVLLTGAFTATPAAAELTRAAHMQGEPVPATVRLSNGSGNPDTPDYEPDVRGLAVKLRLPDGSATDIVSQTAPRFPVQTPEAFIELLRAQRRGPAIAWRFPLFLARHPGAIYTLPANLKALQPPTSYACCRYYAVHAYRFLAAGDRECYVRYTWLPEQPESRLNPLQARRKGRDYLIDELRERISRGPIRFALELQLAEPGDDVDDPSATWPTERRTVHAGTLEITELSAERESEDHVLVFDPARVTDGIELSNDPVLRYRPRAYEASVKRRTSAA